MFSSARCILRVGRRELLKIDCRSFECSWLIERFDRSAFGLSEIIARQHGSWSLIRGLDTLTAIGLTRCLAVFVQCVDWQLSEHSSFVLSFGLFEQTMVRTNSSSSARTGIQTMSNLCFKSKRNIELRWGQSSWAIILKIAIGASISVSNYPSEAKDAQRDGANGPEEQTSTKISIGTCFYLVSASLDRRASTNPTKASIIVLTALRCQLLHPSHSQFQSWHTFPLRISITAGPQLNRNSIPTSKSSLKFYSSRIAQAQSFATVLEDGCQGCLIQEHGIYWIYVYNMYIFNIYKIYLYNYIYLYKYILGNKVSSLHTFWISTGLDVQFQFHLITVQNITLCQTCKICAQTKKFEFGNTCKSVWSPWSFYPSVSSHVRTFQSSTRCNSKPSDFRHLVNTCSDAASNHEFPWIPMTWNYCRDSSTSMQSILVHTWTVISISVRCSTNALLGVVNLNVHFLRLHPHCMK